LHLAAARDLVDQEVGRRIIQVVRDRFPTFSADPSWGDVYRIPLDQIPRPEDPATAPQRAPGPAVSYPIIVDPQAAEAALEGYSGFVGVDVEADGLPVWSPLLALLLTLYPKGQLPVTIVLHHSVMRTADGQVRVPAGITRQLQRPDIIPLWHGGGRYDGPILARHGCDLLQRPVIDTLTCERVLLSGQFPDEDEGERTTKQYPKASLSYCLLRRLGIWLPDKEAKQKEIGERLRGPELPDEDLPYCATDTLYLGALVCAQWAAADDKQRYAMRLEVEMQQLVASITYRGLAVNVALVHEEHAKYVAAQEEPMRQVLELMPGTKITKSGALSEYDLRQRIADAYGIDPASAAWSDDDDRKRQRAGKKPKGRRISVNKDTLAEVIAEGYAWKEVAIPLQAYKKARTGAQQMTESYLQVYEGRCYPQILALATRNSRMAARGPNTQQIAVPHRNIIEADPGEVFVSADLSQIETRFAAVVSDDKKLLAATQADDIYYAIAGILFDIADDILMAHPDKDALRKAAKIVVLALQYGGGWKVVRKQMIANQRPCKVAVAKEKVDHYLDTFEGIKAMAQRAYAEADGAKQEKMGLAIETASGFRRVFDSDELVGTRFVPARISSLAAVGFKLALGLLKDQGWGPYLAMVLHDEITLRVPEHRAQEAADALVAALTAGVELVCPGVCARVGDPIIGRTWSKKPEAGLELEGTIEGEYSLDDEGEEEDTES
jgi:hypothetical protein